MSRLRKWIWSAADHLVRSDASHRARAKEWRPAAALLLVGLIVAAMGPGLMVTARADTLDKIRASKSIVIGYREASVPFSSLGADGKPVGYSIDLCLRIAAAVKQATNLSELAIKYVAVTAENRMTKLEDGDIDIECGTTSRTISRDARVDFTLLTFVTGTELLVHVGSKIDDLSGLEGKKVAVLAGTTTDSVIRSGLQQQMINADVVTVRDHNDGLAALQDGRADAYASDEVILIGLARNAKDVADLRLSGTMYSYEPYAFMVRRNDAEFRLIADRALAQTYRSGDIAAIYDRWFGTWPGRPNPTLVALFRIQSFSD
ncbi:MAG: amino acid ABC transporter substrate-binding protein [Alphaproteobacteria bacterium]|nr:amino acid ABC transporter substrate-binding protein [Alphaproteobacteria bacterium]